MTVAELWQRQKAWSRVADKLKASLWRARTGVLWLGIAGALVETFVATVLAGSGGRMATALVGAVLLAIVPVLRAGFISEARVRRWTRARSVSEGLKSEIFTFLAKASPYEGDDAESVLETECAKIEKSVSDLEVVLVDANAVGSPPPPMLIGEKYLERRALQQVQSYYRPKAAQALRRSQWYRNAEIALATVAAGVAALAAGTAKGAAPWLTSVGAWAAVLTTVGGAVATHAAANRYDFLATGYMATARRIEDLVDEWRKAGAPVSGKVWSGFVSHCESAISIENESWFAKWTEPAPGAAK